MYLCIGKAVTDGQIREAINRGACTRKALVHCRGVGRDCGKCNRRGSRIIALVHSKPMPRSGPAWNTAHGGQLSSI